MEEKKIRVAVVLKSSIYSGAENVAISIIKGLEKKYEFLYIATQGEIESKLIEENVPYELLTEFNLQNIKKALSAFRPDIVHAHDFSATVYCAAFQKKQEYKLISHLHYDPPWARKWNFRTIIYYITAQRINAIVAVTSASYKNNVFAESLKNKTIYLNNPLDITNIERLAEKQIDKSFDLLFVGRLVEQKNPLSFINIVREISRTDKNIKCAMLGDGELKTECKKQIVKYGIENHLELLGYQKNPYCYMKNSKIVCMTSKWEGFGLVAAEANVLEIPVLSTITAGVTEIFGKQAEELCKDEGDMIEKIRCLRKSSQMYLEYKNRAIERKKEFISVNKYLENIDSLYQKIKYCK